MILVNFLTFSKSNKKFCLKKKLCKIDIRFYEKHNFHEMLDIPSFLLERYDNIENLKWYSVLKGDVINHKTSVAGCKVIKINTIPTFNAGELSYFEGTHDVDFDIKRIYYISKVPEGIKRGFHAHKKLQQLLFCPYGRILLILENKYDLKDFYFQESFLC